MRHPCGSHQRTALLTLACLIAACGQQLDQAHAPKDNAAKSDAPLSASEGARTGGTTTPDRDNSKTALDQADHRAGEDPPALKALREGMPSDVSEFIRRAVTCNHWAGEEPYDDDRREQINRAVKNLGCLELDSDQKALRSRYAGQNGVLKRISQSRKTPL
jgi:hypothetical protein